jgi:hypothetical protein
MSRKLDGTSAVGTLPQRSPVVAVAYLVVQQQDKVGRIACGDRSLETMVPLHGRTTHFHA